jgi:hypothetical protein
MEAVYPSNHLILWMFTRQLKSRKDCIVNICKIQKIRPQKIFDLSACLGMDKGSRSLFGLSAAKNNSD